MALLLRASKVADGSPRELVLSSGQIIIGRLPNNHLVLPGSNVEPIHAIIEQDDAGDFNLIDFEVSRSSPSPSPAAAVRSVKS